MCGHLLNYVQAVLITFKFLEYRDFVYVKTDILFLNFPDWYLLPDWYLRWIIGTEMGK